jgi:hypothetical protein
MSAALRALVVVLSVTICFALVSVEDADAMSACSVALGGASVASPTRTGSWRADIGVRMAVFYRLPGRRLRASRWLAPVDAPWLLVLARPRESDQRCWLRVRLPWRPNNAAGWVNANDVVVEYMPWRIEISRAHRTLTLFRRGVAMRTVRVVIGEPSSPTPAGLFAVTWAIRWHPGDFLGSWVIELTGHSQVLHHFDGGDGTVGIHGRGGASLLDPLGSARSHGCVRLANDAIDWLVETVGANRLSGTPVQIS